jgi:hypothetical protein
VIADESCIGGSLQHQFDTVTGVASHEIAEIETDPATPSGDSAWIEDAITNACEIADECENQIPNASNLAINHARPEIPNHNYVVVNEFSNQLFINGGSGAACITHKVASTEDLVFRNGSTMKVLLMSGTWNTTLAPPGESTSFVYVGGGDFNADGYSDIAWWNSATNSVRIDYLKGQTLLGSLSFAGEPSPFVPKAAGDVDGDGISDIVWFGSRTGDVRIWLMNATSIRTVAHPGSVGASTQIFATGDFDRDAKADIFFRSGTTTLIWIMNGGVISRTVSPNGGVAGVNLTLIGIADFNNDGISDLAWTNSTTNTVDFWWLNSNGGLIATKTQPMRTNQAILGVHDVSGDGIADVVFRDTRSGAISAWQMDLNGGATLKNGTLAISLTFSFLGFGIYD